MSSYSGTAGRPDKAKAIGAVLLVHAALAAIILTGLNVRMVSQAVERLTTINIKEPPPPPPPPPPPARKPQQMKKPAGAPAPKAVPTPVVAPQPKLPLPSPIPAAKIAGTGTATSSGASASGTGTGAGGSGNGPGGGGYGNGGNTPARLIRNLTRGDYRIMSSYGMPQGSAVLRLVVNARGAVSSCSVLRSTGAAQIDGAICQLATTRMFFVPAYDSSGRPIAYQFDYFARWH
jgi:protein TonB